MNFLDLIINIRKKSNESVFYIELLKRLSAENAKQILDDLNKWYYNTHEIKEFEDSFLK